MAFLSLSDYSYPLQYIKYPGFAAIEIFTLVPLTNVKIWNIIQILVKMQPSEKRDG